MDGWVIFCNMLIRGGALEVSIWRGTLVGCIGIVGSCIERAGCCNGKLGAGWNAGWPLAENSGSNAEWPLVGNSGCNAGWPLAGNCGGSKLVTGCNGGGKLVAGCSGRDVAGSSWENEGMTGELLSTGC